MKNQYTSEDGKVLLDKTQKTPSRVWNIVKCKYCISKFDMRLVAWENNSPKCPVCGRIQE